MCIRPVPSRPWHRESRKRCCEPVPEITATEDAAEPAPVAADSAVVGRFGCPGSERSLRTERLVVVEVLCRRGLHLSSSSSYAVAKEEQDGCQERPSLRIEHEHEQIRRDTDGRESDGELCHRG